MLLYYRGLAPPANLRGPSGASTQTEFRDRNYLRWRFQKTHGTTLMFIDVLGNTVRTTCFPTGGMELKEGKGRMRMSRAGEND